MAIRAPDGANKYSRKLERRLNMKMKISIKLQEKRKMMTGGDDDDNQTGAKRAKRELGYHGLGAITKLPGIHNSSPDLSFSPEIHNKSIPFSLNT